MMQARGLDDFLNMPQMGRAAILSDLDGCLLSGAVVLPHAADLATRAGDRLWIVSNNSTDTAAGLSARLGRLGLKVPAQRILLAGEETLRRVAEERPAARVALFAAQPLRDLAERLGLVLDHGRPELAILARDTGFRFEDLAALTGYAWRGTPLVLTNPDRTHPAADGSPVPETGALWAALAAAVPEAAARCLGKPAPDLLRRALSRAGVGAADAVFIGDTPETDGAAAAAAGMEFFLVRRPVAARAPEAQTPEAQTC